MSEQFSVIHFTTGWRIFAAGMWRGRFDDRVRAVDAALRLAGDTVRTGQPVRILVQDAFGEITPLSHRRDAGISARTTQVKDAGSVA
jgi:hypothetical protein